MERISKRYQKGKNKKKQEELYKERVTSHVTIGI